MFTGLGTSPSNTANSVLLNGSGIGTEESRALVYGCFGEVYSLSVSAVSMIRPRYITAILSQTCLTTAIL